MSKSNILFIINPISGGKQKLKIPALIDRYIDRDQFNHNFSFTEYVGHASEIAEEAASRNFDVIVAVGGDGTINEVAAKVLQHNKVLGIIPFGSGNGLARFLNIPLQSSEAIKLINRGRVRKIDTGRFNDKPFFNMAGMGFDAHISSVFASDTSRGLSGYLRLGLKEVMTYKPQTYKIWIDGKEYVREAVVLSIANSSQYGNNAHIAAGASVTDGLLDVCIIKAFPLYKLPLLAYEFWFAKTDQSEMVEIIKGKQIRIQRLQDDAIHIDGEPFFMGKVINVDIRPLSLNIIS